MTNGFLRRLGSIGLVVVIAGVAAGCSAGGPRAGLLRPAETSIPKGTSDPRVVAAVGVYKNFLQATVRAQQKPVADWSAYPEDADFGRFSFDPIESEYVSRVKDLSQAKQAFRGTPPQPHITVTSIDPDATPWPTVTLSDCQTGQGAWQVFDTTTGRPVSGQEPIIPRPYGMTVTVVYTQQRWGVNTITMDSDRTCPD